jgi:hypothetical protein
VSDLRGDAAGEGADWPLGLPPLASAQHLEGGFICSTTRGRLAEGREVVVKRCPYPAEWRPTAWRRWPPPAPRCRPCWGRRPVLGRQTSQP